MLPGYTPGVRDTVYVRSLVPRAEALCVQSRVFLRNVAVHKGHAASEAAYRTALRNYML